MANKKNRGKNTKPSQELTAGRREVAVAAQYHQGPIPDPHTLRMYDELLPGAADRILSMAEEQAAHRKEMERIVIKSRSRDSLLGIIAGFLIALTTVICGGYVIVHGYQWSGTFLGSVGLVGLVGVFIYGTNSNRKERESKNNNP